MVSQVSPSTDKKLHRASRTIGKADAQIAIHEEKRKKAWEFFLETADEFNQPELRFLADDGHYMTLQWRQGKPKRNDALLAQKLQAMAAAVGGDYQALWESITVRTVDNNLLEAAVLAGRIPAELLDGVIETPEPTYARIRQPWTKEDKNRAVVLNVKANEDKRPIIK